MLNDDLTQIYSGNINNLFGKLKVQKVVIRHSVIERLDNIFYMSILERFIYRTKIEPFLNKRYIFLLYIKIRSDNRKNPSVK